ncbi:MAG: hypothetical protein P8M78_05595 [Myxococcota bacterium]|nr:hypothetical protein [Myxococcota bacterium]
MKLERVERLNLGLSAGAIAASYALATPHFATSLALGACLEALNFGALMRGARLFFAGEFQGAGPWVGVFALRFVLVGTGILVVLYLGANPIALLVGLSIAMPAVLIDSWLHRPEVVDPATLPALDSDDEEWDRWNAWRAAESRPPVDDEEAEPVVLAADPGPRDGEPPQ